MCFTSVFSQSCFPLKIRAQCLSFLISRWLKSPDSHCVTLKVTESHMTEHNCCTCPWFVHEFSLISLKIFIDRKSEVLLKSVTVREEHEAAEEANEDEPIKIKKRK